MSIRAYHAHPARGRQPGGGQCQQRHRRLGGWVDGGYTHIALSEHWNGSAWSVVPGPGKAKFFALRGLLT